MVFGDFIMLFKSQFWITYSCPYLNLATRRSRNRILAATAPALEANETNPVCALGTQRILPARDQGNDLECGDFSPKTLWGRYTNCNRLRRAQTALLSTLTNPL